VFQIYYHPCHRLVDWTRKVLATLSASPNRVLNWQVIAIGQATRNYSSDEYHRIAIYRYEKRKGRADSTEVHRQRKSGFNSAKVAVIEVGRFCDLRVRQKTIDLHNSSRRTTTFLAIDSFLPRGRAQRALTVSIIRRSCVK